MHALTVLATLSFFLLTVALGAQEPLFVVYDYMKVKPENYDDYIHLEKVWKKIHASRIKRGRLYAWVLDEVISPSGTAQEFNFITANVYQGNAMLAGHYETSMLPENWQELISYDEAQVALRTAQLRDIVKTDVFEVVDQVMAEGWEANANVVVMNFFRNRNGASNEDHARMEAELWKPIHEARVKDGNVQGWMLMNRVFPISYTTQTPYHSITNDYYTDMRQLIESSDNMADYMDKFLSSEEKQQRLAEMWEGVEMLSAVIRRRIDGVMSDGQGDVVMRPDE